MSDKKLNEIAQNIANETSALKTIQNLSTDCYLVGGTLIFGLTKDLYGSEAPKQDIDLAVKSIDLDKLPKEWIVKKHHPKGLPKENFGYRIDTGKEEVDIILFDNHYPGKGEPGIDSYLKNVPFSFHSIAFDLDKSELVGDVGIKSIVERKAWVNNKDLLSEDKGYWQSKLEQKSKLLGFEI